jgi:hypothetical protein
LTSLEIFIVLAESDVLIGKIHLLLKLLTLFALNERIHTYYTGIFPKGVAEASQIFLRDTHVLPKLLSHEEGRKTLAVVSTHRTRLTWSIMVRSLYVQP